jgi:hypothetical protein
VVAGAFLAGRILKKLYSVVAGSRADRLSATPAWFP